MSGTHRSFVIASGWTNVYGRVWVSYEVRDLTHWAAGLGCRRALGNGPWGWNMVVTPWSPFSFFSFSSLLICFAFRSDRSVPLATWKRYPFCFCFLFPMLFNFWVGSWCQIFSKYRMHMCTNMQECACVSSRISMCGEGCVRHVYMSSLCPWFRITVSRNSCLECVNQAAGVSLDQCVGLLWLCACRYTGACTQLHWHVTGVWAQEGLKSSLFKTPLSRRPDGLRMEAVHSRCKARKKRTLVGLAGNRCPKQHSLALANEHRDVL